MTEISFEGFGGLSIRGELHGTADAPAVLLVHGAGQSRRVWDTIAQDLVAAGRRAITIDLRGHGDSGRPSDGRYDLDAFVADLRAVLAQLNERPVVVATTLGAWIATLALGPDAALLASGLVLADLPPSVRSDQGRRVVERLRVQSRAEDWDVRVLGAIDASGVPARLAQAAGHIALPVLLVRGSDSQLDSAAEAKEFAALFPDAEMIEVQGCKLVVANERSDEFGALLLDFLERRASRQVPEYRAGSDARTLRDALGCFATGVTVVTARTSEGRPIGLTANSFTSVSLEPPLLLVCIANNAGCAPVLGDADYFGVNVLQIGQQPVSNRFAGKAIDKFEETDWSPGETGIPLIAGSLCSFECAREAVHHGGDHFILVGRVERATFESRRDPLLYFRGKYRRLHFA